MNSTIWSITGHASYLLLSLIVNVIMARLLGPTDFGIMGIILFFISIGKIFIDSGFAGALIRKSSFTPNDVSTVFFFNAVVSMLLFVLLISISPLIASFYSNQRLTSLLIWSSGIFLINAYTIIPNAKLMMDMQFKQMYLYMFMSYLIASIVGVCLAIYDFGVWSLVVMHLLNSLLYATVLKIKVRWKFSINSVSRDSFKSLFSFGFYTTISSLLNEFFKNINQLIISKYFSLFTAGLYYQANKLQEIPSGILSMLSNSVVFSGLAKLRENERSMLRLYNLIMGFFITLLGVITLYIYLYAELIVKIVLGSQWDGAVMYMQILTFASFFYVQESFNRVLFKLYNKTHKLLLLELVKKTLQILSIVVGIYTENIKFLLLGYVISSAIGYSLNYYYSNKLSLSVSKTKKEFVLMLKVLFSIVFVVLLFDSILNIDFSQVNSIYWVVPIGFIYSCFAYAFRLCNVSLLIQFFKNNR